MRRTVVRTGIAGIITVLVLGACGRGVKQASSKVSTLRLVVGAADVAAAQRSARVSGHARIVIAGESKLVPIDGAVDFTTGAAEMSIDAEAMGLRGLGSIKARVVDHAIYMNFGSALNGHDVPAALRGKKWLVMDLSDAAASNSSTSAGGLLESLRGAGNVRRVGTEDVGGTETDRYHATIDTAKAIAKIKPGPLRDLAEKGLAALGASYPADVWIDQDGRPRRLAIRISTKKYAMSETVDYSDFGVPIHVEKPPASDTADFSTLISEAQNARAN